MRFYFITITPLAAYIAIMIAISVLTGPVWASIIANLVTVAAYIAYRMTKMPTTFDIRPTWEWSIVIAMSVTIIVATIGAAQASSNIATYAAQFHTSSIPESVYEGVPAIITAFLAFIAAPMGEEMLLRGFIQERLCRSMHPMEAILITSITFGCAHMNITQMIVAIPLGIIAGCAFYASNRIITSIGVHMLFNIWVSINPPDSESIHHILPHIITLTIAMVSILYITHFVGKIVNRKQLDDCSVPRIDTPCTDSA